ncbi:MAG: ABC transporter substrate-binding protein [Candidatus Hermodarchaeota archaeon]
MKVGLNKKLLNSLIIIGVFSNIFIFATFSSILYHENRYIGVSGNILNVARTSNPITMDPVDAWDSVSNDMLDQVVETLIAYDLTDPALPLVGRLAESWNWLDNTTIEFKLRENVFFHDGLKFTADCVLHTITRINFFGNWSGTLDPATHTMAFPHSLYKFSDETPIFNNSLSFATDDYKVTLLLNRPYGPAEGLLTYTASSIVHPDSTPANEMLKLGEDLVIGTGPFKLMEYIPNSEIRFSLWERYWATGPYWDHIVYRYYTDTNTANNAMLAGDIDWLGQGIAFLLPDFKADPHVTVTGNGTSDYIAGSLYGYIGFNSEIINKTWRKAICHAFNYTNLIEDIKLDTVIKANSLVPPGFPAHNKSVTGGTYNIPYARQVMQSMGYGYTNSSPWDVGSQVGDIFTTGTNETLWQSAEFTPNVGNFTFNGFNFHHREYESFIFDLLDQFRDDMQMIGIKAANPELRFQWTVRDPPEELHIYYKGWEPEYFETFTMINPFVNPACSTNFGKINNSEINSLLTTILAETNTSQRYEYYKKIQYLIHDKYYYHMPLFYDKLSYVHAETLKGFPYNCMRILYLYPTYRD